MSIQIRLASIDDVEHIVPLFDAYRRFYGQPSDTALARSFLTERLMHKQSIIFLATGAAGACIGFTQLFPSFSSASASRIFILNDLFVTPGERRKGIATALLEEAAAFGRTTGAARLFLATALDNEGAHKLYESIGWKREESFCYYSLSLS